jgi:hypothetical protein
MHGDHACSQQRAGAGPVSVKQMHLVKQVQPQLPESLNQQREMMHSLPKIFPAMLQLN